MGARFLLENKEAIGLGMIYSIVIFLAYCILDTLFNCLKAKFIAKKKVRKVVRKISEFDRAVERARVSSQIRAVMNAQL